MRVCPFVLGLIVGVAADGRIIASAQQPKVRSIHSMVAEVDRIIGKAEIEWATKQTAAQIDDCLETIDMSGVLAGPVRVTAIMGTIKTQKDGSVLINAYFNTRVRSLHEYKTDAQKRSISDFIEETKRLRKDQIDSERYKIKHYGLSGRELADRRRRDRQVMDDRRKELVLCQGCFEELNLVFLSLGGWSAQARRPEMNKRYVVTLTDQERRSLRALLSCGKGAVQKLAHARILLQVDSAEGGVGWTDARVCEGLGVGFSTVERIRKRFVEEGFEAALVPRKSCRVYRRKIDGDDEAHLIALACGTPPAGRRRWTLRLLADKMVTLEYMASLSYETVRGVLKKTNLNLG